MPSIFPDVLFLGPAFAPVLLRVGVAIAYFLIARHFYKHRGRLASEHFPFVGKPGNAIAWLAVISTGLIALFIALGLYLQVAAVVGCVGALKMWWFEKKHADVLPYGRIAYFLLALACLSLVILGAGAFAFDLPY